MTPGSVTIGPESRCVDRSGWLEIAGLDRFRSGPMPDTVLPEYEGLGITNVTATIERHFGIETPVLPLAESALPSRMLEGVRTIVMLVIDALGLDQLQRASERGHTPYLSELLQRDSTHLSALTSTFPSTTVCALTTLGTGLPPGRHGVTSQRIYDSSLGTLVDILSFAPVVAGRGLDTAGVDAGEWLGLPTAFQKLAPQGVAPVVVNHSQFEGTSLSRINHRGARFHGFATISDLCVNLRAAIEGQAGRAYIHSYWGTLDTVTHLYGAHSPQHDAEIQVIDHALGQILLRGLRAPATLLLILADHGHLDTDPARVVCLNDHPELLELLQAPPTGLDRASTLYVRAGFEDAAREFVERHFSECALVLSGEEAIDLGLYGAGPVTSVARQRIGQLLLLPRENWVLRYNRPGRERRHMLVGTHGGLHREEMLVPLISLRLD